MAKTTNTATTPRQMLRQESEAIALRIDTLSKNADHKPEVLTEMVKQVPLRVMQDVRRLAQYAEEQQWGRADMMAVMAYVSKVREFLQQTRTDDDCTLTYDETWHLYDQVQTWMIMIHRLNFVLRMAMLDVMFLLEDEGRLRFQTKRAWRAVDDEWQRYEQPRRRRIEAKAWKLLGDHLQVNYNHLHPSLEQTYERLRDRMIALGWRDCELWARLQLALMVGRVCEVTFHRLFDDIRRDYHVDMRHCFEGDNLTAMTDRMAQMADALGRKTAKAPDGVWRLAGFDTGQSHRIESAWKRFIAVSRDLDLQDDAALRAIELNPEAQEEYRAVLAQQQAEYEAAIAEQAAATLAQRFTVKKSKK